MKRFQSITIKQLALAIVSAMLLSMALLGGYMLLQAREVTASFQQHQREAAHAELKSRLDQLLTDTDKQATQIANWEETHRQWSHTGQHERWRDQRVYEAGLLHRGTAALALYAPDGLILGALSGGWPLRLTTPSGTPSGAAWITQDDEVPTLYRAFAIHNPGNKTRLEGYGLIRLDVLASLRNQTFHFIDPDSLHLKLSPGETLDPASLASRVQLNTRPDAEQARYQAIFSRTLLALFVLLGTTALAGYWLYDRLLVKPLRQLSKDLDDMQQSDQPKEPRRPAPQPIAELDNVRRSLYDYQLQLRELHNTLANQNKEFHSQARHDALTGCHNRRAYEEDWKDFMSKVESTPQGVAFLLFDCDRFKAINDTYGHAKGDRVLCIIADALVMALRAHDRLYRLGGDEFAAFLSRTTPAQARQIGQRCQSLIDAARFTDLGIVEPVGISIGVAFCDMHAQSSLDELPKQADIAMYTAKQPGHQRIAVYGEDTEAGSQTLVANRETSALFQALAQPGMIEMHYQPIHALPGRQVAYYEALARIRYHNQLLMPAAFLPVVSSRRLETEFDLAVLQQVDADLTNARLPEGCGISVNISAQSISRPEVVSTLMELSRHTARHPLMLEITETSLITQMLEVRTYLDLLRTVNFKIAMDDFGTGYSPLRYLVDLPVDIVKFDISLIKKLEETSRASQIVSDFARMMKDAGYSLVAEGIETEVALTRVQALGFAHVQGYLLGRPKTLDQLDTSVPHTIA
ncbi:MAG: bifunctional diguanylate cyclase/phosphodiesterase [Thiobacillus sp.]